MNTKDAPNALAPVYIELPTIGQFGTIENENYLNTGRLNYRDVQAIRSKPFDHQAARIIDASGSYLMVFPFVGLLLSVILFASSRYAQPGTEATFVPWGALSTALLAAVIIAKIISSRIVAKDGELHSGAIATSVDVFSMIPVKDLPANIKQLSDDLDRHRTVSHCLRIAPAFDAYTSALTAVTAAAHAYANLDPDAAAASHATRLHHIPAVQALADKHAANLAAAKDAEHAAHLAVHAFSDATEDARILTAIAR